MKRVKISLELFSHEDISLAFSKLKPKKSLEPDGIPLYVDKGCKEFLIVLLTHIRIVIISLKADFQLFAVCG